MITKLDAAEAQLNTAIRLFFENRDHLSSYALTVASREITDDLVEKKSSELFNSEQARLGDPTKVRLSLREELRKNSMRFSRKWQNFLKHANQDPEREMNELPPQELALNIMFACWNYRLLQNRITSEMTKFAIWFYSAHPEYTKLSSDPLSAAIEQCRQACPDDPYDSGLLETIFQSLDR